ncbi:hypothetical protein [Novosphingobium rosa]|uniref:hypothetical protein n=1 Tax=Novosphingobium rosa TaxID=76978 RepID=UPI0012EDE295|nr:hypothetical protein [Novosphingobium rosa]
MPSELPGRVVNPHMISQSIEPDGGDGRRLRLRFPGDDAEAVTIFDGIERYRAKQGGRNDGRASDQPAGRKEEGEARPNISDHSHRWDPSERAALLGAAHWQPTALPNAKSLALCAVYERHACMKGIDHGMMIP